MNKNLINELNNFVVEFLKKEKKENYVKDWISNINQKKLKKEILNKKSTPGGAKTNFYGKNFENYTDLDVYFKENNYTHYTSGKINYLIKEDENYKIICLKQRNFSYYIKKHYNIDDEDIFRYPDEAYIIENKKNNEKYIKILEKNVKMSKVVLKQNYGLGQV
jgi:hypothetical protein